MKIDCKTAKDILQNDVKNLVSKQIFARWHTLLSNFDFEIEFIKGELNSLPDFLIREFLQDKDPSALELDALNLILLNIEFTTHYRK